MFDMVYPSANARSLTWSEGPQAGRAWMSSGDQGSGDQDHDLVLQHVRAEELFPQFVQRRGESEEESQPSGKEAGVTLAEAGKAATAYCADDVDRQQGRQRKDDRQLPAPGHSPQRRCRRSFVRVIPKERRCEWNEMHGLVRGPQSDNSQGLSDDQEQGHRCKQYAEPRHKFSPAGLRLCRICRWKLAIQADGEQ